jgi:phosphomannomutase
MASLTESAAAWIDGDPDPKTRALLGDLVARGDEAGLRRCMDGSLTFGTAGIRGEVGPGPAMMNRAVVIRTTHGLVSYLGETDRPVIVGFDARPTSRTFAEDTAGVLAAAGLQVVYFDDVTPTPLVAFTAKHLEAAAAVVVTASHNPPADNGYKVYGPDAAQIVPPIDEEIQAAIETAPAANAVSRIDAAFSGGHAKVRLAPEDMVDRYWEEVAACRTRRSGSDLHVVYTPIHGVGRDMVFDMMSRAGHTGVVAVAEQAEPDGTFPTVAFPNPEEPGALDLALDLARERDADLVIANDPDADRLAAVIPHEGTWRPLTGNEVGVLLGDYVLAGQPSAGESVVVSSIVSSPMLGVVAAAHGARWERTLTGFKWIVKAGLTLETRGEGRFVFGYEEALGYTIGATVRDKDGMSAAVIFTDLVADLADQGKTVLDRLGELWREHGLWVSAQVSVTRSGPDGANEMLAAVEHLAEEPPDEVGSLPVASIVDYRSGAEGRPPWLGRQDLVELSLGEKGRILVRPSGTEPKLKIYVDLRESLGHAPPETQRLALVERATRLGRDLESSLAL